MNKLKWILLIVFWFHTIIMAQAVTAEEKNEVTKNKTNTKFKLLDYEVDETKKTTTATVEVSDTNKDVTLNFINTEANQEDEIPDNTIQIPSDFHFVLEDKDSAPIGVIESSSSKNPALLINLFKYNDSTRDIIIKPKIQSNGTGLKVNPSKDIAVTDKVFQYNITVDSTTVEPIPEDSTTVVPESTAVDLNAKVTNLKINDSKVNSKQAGIALNADSDLENQTNFISNSIIVGNPAISVNGDNYKLDLLLSSQVKSNSETESAIEIKANNTYLVNNLGASISATETAILIDENATGNNIYNYGSIEGRNPLIVRGKNNKITCIKTNNEQQSSSKKAINAIKTNETTDEQGIIVYGELTINNDSSDIITDFHALEGSNLMINNSSGTIQSDVINIQDSATVIIENGGNLYTNITTSTNSSNVKIFNNKTQDSKIYADENKNPAKLIFTGDTAIRNQGDIYCNTSSSKQLNIENTLDANIRFIKNTDTEAFVSTGNLNINNHGLMTGDMIIKTNNTDQQNITLFNDNLIVSNFDFEQPSESSTEKFVDFSNESHSKLALVIGDIKTIGFPISLKNNGGLFLAKTIGNQAYKSGISIFNEEHGYWGVIKSEKIFANDIHNKDSGYIIANDISFSTLINASNSILHAGTMTLCKKTAGSIKAQIANSSFIFANKITAEGEYGIITNEYNKNLGKIVTSKITNIQLNNPPNAFVFVADDLELVDTCETHPTKSQIALTKNSGNLIADNIILKHSIINEGSIIASTITSEKQFDKDLVSLKNNYEVLCNTVKNISILNEGIITITAINKSNKVDHNFTSNKVINKLIVDNKLDINADDTTGHSDDDKSLQVTIDAINKEVINLQELEILEATETQLNTITTKNLASIKAISDYFNISGTPQFAGNVCINLTQGAKLILDNNIGVVNNAKLYIRQLNNKSGASKYIPIAKDAISGKLINKNELHLMAGSYLDNYEDKPGSKLIIEVNEALTNFAKDKNKALVNVKQPTNLNRDARIILNVDKTKQNNLPKNLEIKVLTSQQITYNKDEPIPKTHITIKESDKEKNFLHISKATIELTEDYKRVFSPSDPENNKVNTNTDLTENMQSTDAIAYSPDQTPSEESSSDQVTLEADSSVQTPESASLIVNVGDFNDEDGSEDNDKDNGNDNNDNNSTDDSKKHKTSVLETVTHKQIQRLISAYLYKNNCNFCCSDNQSCLTSNSNSIWAKYLVSNLTQLPKNNNSQLDAKLQALVVGIDYKQDSSTIGFATAIANADSTIDKQQQYDSSFNEYMLYFNYKKSEYFINALYSYATGKHQLQDSLDTNKYNSYNNSFHLIAGNCLYNYGLQISPNLSLKFSNIIKKQHEIITNNQTLVVDSAGYFYIEAGIGAAIEKAWCYKNIITKLYGRFMAYHDIKNSSGYKAHSRELDLAIDVNYQRFSVNLEYIYQWEHKFKANSIVATVQYAF
jgi:hypothetical protein